MRLIISAFFTLFFVGAGLGCATESDTRMGTEPENAYANSNADPYSYGADGFTFNKKQKRRAANDFMFYFKHCAQNDDRAYYSRTSYWCTDP